ncbi:MAG: type II toxin-antitoxin system VapB family antitoxin [Elusimicrobia bacterium]|nr:type II toxin-antitoxin system VapB family antitoxin [Elusimicrobiota bacterium]
MHKTTLMLDDSLFKQAKRLALEQDKPLRAVVEEALRQYLYKPSHAPAQGDSLMDRFPPFNASLKGGLDRGSIYEEYLEHKVPKVKERRGKYR